LQSIQENNKKKKGFKLMKNIKAIVTHLKPHLDEFVAVWMLLVFGAKKFLFEAELKWEQMALAEMPRSLDNYPEHLFVGCADSPYDEHALSAEEYEKTCSAQLVAEDLVGYEPCLHLLIGGVRSADRGKKSATHLGTVVKALQEIPGVRAWDIYFWLKRFLNLVLETEKELFEKISAEVESLYLTSQDANREEFKNRFSAPKRAWATLEFKAVSAFMAKHGHSDWVDFGKKGLAHRQFLFDEAIKEIVSSETKITQKFKSVVGGEIEILAIDTNNPLVPAASRKLGYGICVVRNGLGNIVVQTAEENGAHLYNVAAKLRRAEMVAGGQKPLDDWKHLSQEGTLKECPQWHLHQGIGGRQLYNGTLSHIVEPTALSPEEIVEIIISTLSLKSNPKPHTNRPPIQQGRKNGFDHEPRASKDLPPQRANRPKTMRAY
jgi:hypothetical protein